MTVSFVALSIRDVKLETPAMEDTRLGDILATPVGEERVFAIGFFAYCIKKRQGIECIIVEIPASFHDLGAQAVLNFRIKRKLVQSTTDHQSTCFQRLHQ